LVNKYFFMTDVQQPVEWSIKAQNLPEHARNPIHTDAGARAAGFSRALVAGVTTYAYMTHPLVVAWGEDWLARGGGEIRFRRPVFDQDVLRCVPVFDDNAVEVQAITSEPEQPRAIFRAVRDGGAVQPLRDGEVLPSKEFELIDTFSCDYGSRAGDDLSFFADRGLVHPAVWPALANDIVYNYLARGSWVHMRSIIRHHATAPVGATAELRSVVVNRFESHGERAVLDVHIVVNDQVVASLEHEAIVALP
jgi:acyl dehydratase